MKCVVMGPLREDGLISIEFLGNLDYEENQKFTKEKGAVILEKLYEFPEAAVGIGYTVLVDPVKKEYVYEPYEVPQEGPQEETVAKLREELVAANERLEALTEQVAALTNRMGVE